MALGPLNPQRHSVQFSILQCVLQETFYMLSSKGDVFKHCQSRQHCQRKLWGKSIYGWIIPQLLCPLSILPTINHDLNQHKCSFPKYHWQILAAQVFQGISACEISQTDLLKLKLLRLWHSLGCGHHPGFAWQAKLWQLWQLWQLPDCPSKKGRHDVDSSDCAISGEESANSVLRSPFVQISLRFLDTFG